MGPLYSLRHDPAAAAAATQGRAIHTPEPLNRAFGPSGFLRSFDLRPELGRIVAPTLILCGRHDWICPPEFSREIAGLIPGSRLIELENSSHSVRVDAPDVLLREVTAFIEGA
jgi:proline iminopeptidase